MPTFLCMRNGVMRNGAEWGSNLHLDNSSRFNNVFFDFAAPSFQFFILFNTMQGVKSKAPVKAGKE